jgi:mycofactocin system glycosyltransferase
VTDVGAAQPAPTSPGWPGPCTLDPSTRLLDGGRIVVGGSPLRILRLTDRGARLVCDLTVPEPATGPLPATERALLRRLLDAGILHPHPRPLSPAARPEVTVVVPTYDDAAALERTLGALTCGTTPIREVLVVDDGSNDPWPVARAASGASAGALAPADTPKAVRLIRRSVNGGPAAARNTGLAEARTDLVAFVDAGCEPDRRWLERLLPHFGDPDLAVVAPRIVATAGAAGARGAIAAYERGRSPLDLGATPGPVRARTRISYVPAAAMVVRRRVAEAVGGFDETLRVGEDVDLVWRVGPGRYEPAATVGHDHRTAPGPWLRRRFDYGTSAAPLARRHPGAVTPVGVSGWSALAWGLVVAGQPLAGVGLAAATTVLLSRKLQALPGPGREALRLGARGHLGAGRVLAGAVTREWWPLAAGLALTSRRGRRAVVAAAALPALADLWRDRRGTGLDPLRYVALHLADDLAYGTGVWAGCVRERTVAPLVPDLRSWPGRAPT